MQRNCTTGKLIGLASLSLGLCLWSGSAFAQALNHDVALDENGHATLDGSALSVTLGDASTPPTWNIPFSLGLGDVVIDEPTGVLSDLLRFTADSTGQGTLMQLWSDVGDGDLSDVGLPSNIDPNALHIKEDINGVAVYNPDFSLGPFRYTIFSGGDVPEPGAYALISAASMGLLAIRRRRK